MTLRLSLGELIASIPTILDVVPSEAVVALAVNEDRLPTCAFVIEREALLDPARCGLVSAAIAEEFAASRTLLAVLVSYTETDVRDGCPALDALRLEVEYSVPRVEALAVSGGAWFRPGCHEPDCCPPGGRPMVAIPPSAPRVFSAARARAEADHQAMAAVVARAQRRDAAAEDWEVALASGEVADAATARRLAAVLDDLCVRDWVVLTLLGASPDAANDALDGIDSGAVSCALDAALKGGVAPDPLAVERARVVVERVARAARGRRRRAATQTLAGVLEWWEGNLGAARERCERALANDGDYRLAELVRLASSQGIAPGWKEPAGQTGQ